MPKLREGALPDVMPEAGTKPSRMTPRRAAAVAFLLCAVGYGDMIRGGITLSAVALALAYVAIVPLAILSLGWQAAPRPLAERPPWLVACAAAGGVLALYLLTLAPSTAQWDASEYIAAGYTLGIPHPPGNPVFVLLARVFSVLPIAPSVAARINVLAALCSAVAAGVWCLLAYRLTEPLGLARWQRQTVAIAGTAIGAAAFTVWHQSVVNEKVYTVTLAGVALVSWQMLRWIDEPAGPRANARLALVAYLLALGYANHIAGLLPAPAVALAVLVRRPRALLEWRLLVILVAVAAIGLSPFLTQPIRAAQHPPLNEGEPTACRDGLGWSCTFSRGTWEAFSYNALRGQYGKPPLTDRQAPLRGQVGMYWLYFKWQWVRDPYGEHPRRQAIVAALFLVAAALGGWLHWRGARASFWYCASLFGLMSLGLVVYLNFRLGASQAPIDGVAHEVRDRDYFFLWSYSALGVWASVGLAWAGHWLAIGLRSARVRRLATVAPVVLAAAVPLAANWRWASRRGDYTTIAFARDLLNSVEPYALLVTAGDNDTFPLWYAQEVEGIRPDVTVAVTSLLNTDWFARGLIRRPVPAYDTARGPALYRGRAWVRPATAPLPLTLQEADSVPLVSGVREPVELRRSTLTATIDPRNLPQDGSGTGILERADMLVLTAIARGWPERPVYFSRTVGDYAHRLGLGERLLTQGLARKLVDAPIVASRDTVLIEGDGWLDVATSRALWLEVFQGPEEIGRRAHWIDRPSISTPATYLFAGSQLADVLRARGDTAEHERVAAAVSKVSRTLRATL